MKRNMRSAQAIQNMFDDRVSRLIEGVGANVSGKKKTKRIFVVKLKKILPMKSFLL